MPKRRVVSLKEIADQAYAWEDEDKARDTERSRVLARDLPIEEMRPIRLAWAQEDLDRATDRGNYLRHLGLYEHAADYDRIATASRRDIARYTLALTG